MKKELKFSEIIDNIVGEINEAKIKSEKIHSAGNIKSAGDEVESLIREKISLFLPERYMVKQGHIVNSDGKVSNQFDIIIFDRLNTPKFFESQNKTVFYPIESVLAVGEIKKTLRKKDAIEFRKKIKYLKVDMNRKLIENSGYDNKITGKTTLFDIANVSINRKYKNPLFSFLFAIDELEINKIEIDDDYNYMPNDIYVLNYGSLLYAEVINKEFITKNEDENPCMDKWVVIRKPGVNCLGLMFNQLINHLNSCYIRPFSISNYMSSEEDFEVRGSDISIYDFNKPIN